MELLILTWLLITAAVLVLALRRFALSWRDHTILKVHPANLYVEHMRVRNGIEAVYRWGEALTMVVAAYSVALFLILAYQLYDEAIRKIEQLLRIL